MKFYPQPILRFFYRYGIVAILVLLPLWASIDALFHWTELYDKLIIAIPYFLLSVLGSYLIHIALWEKCFSVLILTDEDICWKCPFRKTRRINLADCVEIGAYVENANKGIPSEQIYFSDYVHPRGKMDKNGVMKASQHLIKFPYSDALGDYIMKSYPSKLTSSLSAFRRQRKQRK